MSWFIVVLLSLDLMWVSVSCGAFVQVWRVYAVLRI